MTGPESPVADRQVALTAFYAAHHRRLPARVHAHARKAGPAGVEDACAYAWMTLVRRTDIGLDHHGYAWLVTVAVREAWRLADSSREQPAGPFLPHVDHPDELPEPAGPSGDPLDHAIAAELHRARVAAFSCLEERERRELLLHAGGYSYHEVAALTDTTYTAVNHRLVNGRSRLRRIWGANSHATGLQAV